jgi:hypothetical protein
MSALDELENRLKLLLEHRLVQLLPGNKEDALARRLAESMHTNLATQPDGAIIAPNVYVIVANPAKLTSWRVEPGYLDSLTDALQEAGKEAGLQFASRPAFSTSGDPAVPMDDVRVIASHSVENMSTTQNVPTGSKPDLPPDSMPMNAFLVLGGTQIIPLAQQVINIGRRLDNHVVVDDPRVSRNHAQMRVIKGRFVIFDLDSSGGTFVNGQRTNQSILYPGDVISLAGVTLVFGQDLPFGHAPTEQTRGSAVSSERPTAVLKRDTETRK